MEYVQAFEEKGYHVLALSLDFIAEQQVYKIYQITLSLSRARSHASHDAAKTGEYFLP